MIAFTLLGSVHHLFFTSGLAPLDEAHVRQIADALVNGLAMPGAARPGTEPRRPAAAASTTHHLPGGAGMPAQ